MMFTKWKVLCCNGSIGAARAHTHSPAQHLLFDWKILEILIYCHWTQFSFSSETIFFCFYIFRSPPLFFCCQFGPFSEKQRSALIRPIAIGNAWNQKACRPYEYWSFFIFRINFKRAVSSSWWCWCVMRYTREGPGSVGGPLGIRQPYSPVAVANDCVWFTVTLKTSRFNFKELIHIMSYASDCCFYFGFCFRYVRHRLHDRHRFRIYTKCFRL